MVLVLPPELDLVLSAGMSLHSSDRHTPLDGPGRCHQTDHRDRRTNDQEKIHVPFRVGSRFVQEVGPGQEQQGW